MATSNAIKKALAILQSVFPRDLTPELAEAYHLALADVDDDTLGESVGVCLRTCKFFPVPAELRAAMPRPRALPVDAMGVARQIQSLGHYNPHGWVYPSVKTVREKMGRAAAEAYGTVGSDRLYSENETTRGIAERDFAQVLREEIHTDPSAALPQPNDKILDGPIHPDLLKRLKADTGWTA